MLTRLFIFTAAAPCVLVLVAAIDRDHAHDVLENWVSSDASGVLGLADFQFLAEIPDSQSVARRPGIVHTFNL